MAGAGRVRGHTSWQHLKNGGDRIRDQVCEVWKVGTEVIDIDGGVNEGEEEEEVGGWWWIKQ